MTRPILFLAAVLTALTIFAAPVAAGTPTQGFSDPDVEIMRGDTRYYEGDYYRALTAYKEFLWKFPDDHRADRVRLKKAWIYYNSEQYREAAGILDKLATDGIDDFEGWWSRLYFGQVAMDAGRTPLANHAFEQVLEICEPIIADTDDETFNPDIETCVELTARARIALASVSTSRHNFEAAIEHLENLPEQSPWAEEALETADIVRGISIPQKSPALAGTLSIVPGLGHFYLGEYGTGVLAMAWNGIFIYGLVDSILAGNYGQAVLIGLLESVWYSGTIFGAMAGAHRHNRDARRKVQDGLGRDIDHITSDQPWPARFPARSPGYLELRFEF